MKKYLVGFILGTLIFSGVAYATSMIEASRIQYNDTTLDLVLDDLYNKASGGSNIISDVSFNEQAGGTNIEITVNVTATDSTKVLGYHANAVDGNGNKTSVMSNSNVININGLNIDTNYTVSVIAYDINNNYKSSAPKEVKTLAEPIKLIPNLTSNTSAGGVAFATSTANGRSAYEAFDGVIRPTAASGNSPGYIVTNNGSNQIGYDFGSGNQHMVTKVVYYGHPSDENTRYTTFTLQYSDNGSSWTDVQTFNPRNPTSYSSISDLAETFSVTNEVSSHRYWRISATNANHGWSGLLELEFWGY